MTFKVHMGRIHQLPPTPNSIFHCNLTSEIIVLFFFFGSLWLYWLITFCLDKIEMIILVKIQYHFKLYYQVMQSPFWIKCVCVITVVSVDENLMCESSTMITSTTLLYLHNDLFSNNLSHWPEKIGATSFRLKWHY